MQIYFRTDNRILICDSDIEIVKELFSNDRDYNLPYIVLTTLVDIIIIIYIDEHNYYHMEMMDTRTMKKNVTFSCIDNNNRFFVEYIVNYFTKDIPINYIYKVEKDDDEIEKLLTYALSEDCDNYDHNIDYTIKFLSVLSNLLEISDYDIYWECDDCVEFCEIDDLYYDDDFFEDQDMNINDENDENDDEVEELNDDIDCDNIDGDEINNLSKEFVDDTKFIDLSNIDLRKIKDVAGVYLDESIDYLELPDNTSKCLKKEGVSTIRKLLKKSLFNLSEDLFLENDSIKEICEGTYYLRKAIIHLLKQPNENIYIKKISNPVIRNTTKNNTIGNRVNNSFIVNVDKHEQSMSNSINFDYSKEIVKSSDSCLLISINKKISLPYIKVYRFDNEYSYIGKIVEDNDNYRKIIFCLKDINVIGDYEFSLFDGEKMIVDRLTFKLKNKLMNIVDNH